MTAVDESICPPHRQAALPPVWRWTSRKTLTEERRWHRTQPKWHGWYSRACRAVGVRGQHRLEPAENAKLYRALHKRREDSKDEPGAADFYYGEMEMRRHNPAGPYQSDWCWCCTSTAWDRIGNSTISATHQRPAVAAIPQRRAGESTADIPHARKPH